MTSRSKSLNRPLYLGIEGGGTRTTAILADAEGRLVQRVEGSAGNSRLLTDFALEQLLKSIAAKVSEPDAIAIGMSGVRAKTDSERIRAVAGRVWHGTPCLVTSDLEIAMLAAKAGGDIARVLIISGTGSSCYGLSVSGRAARAGGWGHVLGDGGSAYSIAVQALRAIATSHDEHGKWPLLGRRLLRRLHLNEPHELITWAQAADKASMAGLAPEVFAAWRRGDPLAGGIITEAGEDLVRQAIDCARPVAPPGEGVQFIFTGSTLLKQPEYARRVGARLRQLRPGSVIIPLKREGAWGAIALARKAWETRGRISARGPAAATSGLPAGAPNNLPFLSSNGLSPTEKRNPRSTQLDKLSLEQAIKLMLNEERRVSASIRRERSKIAQAVRWISSAFARGGSLLYVGAGTSGRLGVLDASECPPTFSVNPNMVRGIIAGGPPALIKSVEGAEDDSGAGTAAIAEHRVGRRDVVVGIAASGRTPFVWGALGEARRRGAKTILLCFNPRLRIGAKHRPDLVIAPNVGPEVLTGSTRLKCGTATKLILNMFTTLAMVRRGKVRGNLMVNLNPSNTKLRDRAIRIVSELCGVDRPAAQTALVKAGWNVRISCALLRRRGSR